MIGTDWSRLASFLGLSQDVDIIDHENRLISRKALRTLTKWQEKLGEQASVESLLHALEKLERQDIVIKIKNQEKYFLIYRYFNYY